MRDVILLWLLYYCMTQVFLRQPIKWVADHLATWGEPERETVYRPAGYREGSWRS